MSKKANPTTIGIFVILALGIAASAIVILGGGKLFNETVEHVLFFEGDLSGLDVGAPVEFKGVQIGSVTSIKLKYDTNTGTMQIPVYIELEHSRIEYVGGDAEGKGVEFHIEQGLRAQLHMQSLVTGKLKIMIVEEPKSKVRLVGADPDTIEIPTIPTVTESLVQSLDEMPIPEIIGNVNSTLEEIAQIFGSDDTKQAIQSMDETILNIQALSENISAMLAEDSPLRIELMNTLSEISEAARSFRLLTDQLERQPESLLRGK